MYQLHIQLNHKVDYNVFTASNEEFTLVCVYDHSLHSNCIHANKHVSPKSVNEVDFSGHFGKGWCVVLGTREEDVNYSELRSQMGLLTQSSHC